MNKWKKAYCIASFIFAICVCVFTIAYSFAEPTVMYAAQAGDNDANHATDGIDGIHITVDTDSEDGTMSAPIRILLLLTILTLAPSILIMLTSYTRIIIVLHFVRTAIGTQTAPPNQVLIGLALFLTFFIMWPTFDTLNTTVIEPLDKNEITTEQAFELAEVPIREFMYKYTQEQDLELFIDISGERYETPDDAPMTVIIPAFIIGIMILIKANQLLFNRNADFAYIILCCWIARQIIFNIIIGYQFIFCYWKPFIINSVPHCLNSIR